MSEIPKPSQNPGPIHYQEKVVGNDQKELEEWEKYNDDMKRKRPGRPPKNNEDWKTVRED